MYWSVSHALTRLSLKCPILATQFGLIWYTKQIKTPENKFENKADPRMSTSAAQVRVNAWIWPLTDPCGLRSLAESFSPAWSLTTETHSEIDFHSIAVC